MWQWLKKIFAKKKASQITPMNTANLSEEGIHYRRMLGESVLLPWDRVREFGFSFHQAIYPDPWFGDYMEASWFFTIADDDRPYRIFFDVENFSLKQLPSILFENLPGFDIEAIKPGWKAYQVGLSNFAAEGQWVAWRQKGFQWSVNVGKDLMQV